MGWYPPQHLMRTWRLVRFHGQHLHLFQLSHPHRQGPCPWPCTAATCHRQPCGRSRRRHVELLGTLRHWVWVKSFMPDHLNKLNCSLNDAKLSTQCSLISQGWNFTVLFLTRLGLPSLLSSSISGYSVDGSSGHSTSPGSTRKFSSHIKVTVRHNADIYALSIRHISCSIDAWPIYHSSPPTLTDVLTSWSIFLQGDTSLLERLQVQPQQYASGPSILDSIVKVHSGFNMNNTAFQKRLQS